MLNDLKNNISFVPRISKLIESSLVGDLVLQYLDKHNIPNELRNNAYFIKLLISMLYVQNEVSLSSLDADSDFMDSWSPDDIAEYYNLSEEAQDKIWNKYCNLQEKSDANLKNGRIELQSIEGKLSSFMVLNSAMPISSSLWNNSDAVFYNHY